MPKSSKDKDLDKLSSSTAVVGLDDLIALLNSPKRLGWLRFYSGFMTGMGATIGAAVILVLLGVAIKYFGGVPWIGDLLHRIGDAAQVSGS